MQLTPYFTFKPPKISFCVRVVLMSKNINFSFLVYIIKKAINLSKKPVKLVLSGKPEIFSFKAMVLSGRSKTVPTISLENSFTRKVSDLVQLTLSNSIFKGPRIVFESERDSNYRETFVGLFKLRVHCFGSNYRKIRIIEVRIRERVDCTTIFQF